MSEQLEQAERDVSIDPAHGLGHAQHIGVFGALGLGGYIALVGLWDSPIVRALFTEVNRPDQD